MMHIWLHVWFEYPWLEYLLSFSATHVQQGDIFNTYEAENKGEEMIECGTWYRIETVQFETSYNLTGDSTQGMPFFPLF
jgi:hypothetical protein